MNVGPAGFEGTSSRGRLHRFLLGARWLFLLAYTEVVVGGRRKQIIAQSTCLDSFAVAARTGGCSETQIWSLCT